ncbi:MAG: hypothetical protein K6E51_08830 [Treponema sp.]|nr:hypothetical protein [Treponema sp.]
MAVIVGSLCVVNLLLWFIFFKKFTKIFSTDDIIQKTRNELNNLIADVNRNAERNITLIDDRIQTLKEIVQEADNHISLAKAEIRKRNLQNEYSQSLQQAASVLQEKKTASPTTPAMRAAQSYKKHALFDTHISSQTDLFDQPEQIAESSSVPTQEHSELETQPVMVAPDGMTYKNVPVIGPQIHISDDPVLIPKDFTTQVQERYARGETIDEIARALNSSVTEVQFALDMNE